MNKFCRTGPVYFIFFLAMLQAAAPDSVLNIIYTSGAGLGQEKSTLDFHKVQQEIQQLQSQKYPLLIFKTGHVCCNSHITPNEQLANVASQFKIDAMMPDFDDLYGGAQRFAACVRAQKNLPALILTNFEMDSSAAPDDPLLKLYRENLLQEYIIVHKGGYKIGIFAVLGNEVIFKLRQSPGYKFKDPELAAQQASRFLKFYEKVDFVICLTSSGMSVKPGGEQWSGETQYLGVKAPDIDVIISGGTNCQHADSILSKNTPVLQAADNTTEISFASVSIDGSQRKIVDRAHWLFPDDASSGSLIIGKDLPASGLGQLLSDAMLQAIRRQGKTVDFALLLNENIRGILSVGRSVAIEEAQIAKVLPDLKIAGLANSGLPLLRFYLDGKDLQKTLEVTSSVYPLKGDNYFIHSAGLKARYNTSRIIFNRVVQAELQRGKNRGEPVVFEKERLYAVVSDWVTAQRLQIMHGMTSGFLRITLRDAQGKAVRHLAQALIQPPLSLRQATLQYCDRFVDRNGDAIPDIPKIYLNPQPRIEVISSMKPQDFLRNPNIVMIALIVISLLMVAGVAAVIVVLIRRIRA